jgi:3-deoxy-manno-octulosonate cytidylyltransferase (CMP-KDO synthetase)
MMKKSLKVTAIIPARYASSRFPGKPLANISGKPMIWWVYNQVKKVQEFDEVIVATDSDIIIEECNKYSIKTIKTSDKHPTHINRLKEVSDNITSDLYVCVCGDEPLIDPETIKAVIPQKEDVTSDFYIGALMREFSEPTEVIDPANIKITTNDEDYCVSLSRSPIPFPYKTIQYKYKKIVGVECYSKAALDFFASTKAGCIEKIEDVTLLRFLENRIPMKFKLVNTNALSVDTPRDLEKVREIIKQRGDYATN